MPPLGASYLGKSAARLLTKQRALNFGGACLVFLLQPFVEFIAGRGSTFSGPVLELVRFLIGFRSYVYKVSSARMLLRFLRASDSNFFEAHYIWVLLSVL